MKDNLFMCIYLFFIFVIILVINMLTPKFTRKEIVFGVRIPEDKIDSDEIKYIEAKFVKNNLIIGIPFIILFSVLNYSFLNVGMILFTTFAFTFIIFLIYLISNRAMKNLKLQKSWFQGKKQVVTVDTSFSRSKSNMLVSAWFFLIPAAIIIVNIILGYMNYDSLPYKVPTHWDFSGNVTGYQFKSRFLIWEMPITQIFTTFMFFIIYKGIGWSKQQISSIDPEASIKKNSIFRRSWSMYMVIFAVMTNLLLTVATVQRFRVFNVSNTFSNIIILAFALVTILSSIVLAFKIGQGGSNIKFKNDGEEKGKPDFGDKDDDKCWVLGNTIYYNKNDPSLFVEKRFGIGWTINAGRPLGMAVYIGIIVIIIVTIAFAVSSGK
ncbi:DUF1648 domain-containing protein [Clostridium ljungdahlii]|uniref:DUF1648 domain-containing protein n=1 Tax=Clostridium ljungdahlii TaxID=1538 RepID=A0A168NTJ2_9CLOT|nr:DUF5808 domain-containing protein [Clostridium ljungdahlii]OAA86879.1 hypothetical protein WY13_02273 [Clostridium ljungdahlii]